MADFAEHFRSVQAALLGTGTLLEKAAAIQAVPAAALEAIGQLNPQFKTVLEAVAKVGGAGGSAAKDGGGGSGGKGKGKK